MQYKRLQNYGKYRQAVQTEKRVIEHFFTCPYCWERISMLLDPSEGESSYVEDCEVCCRPIEIHFRFLGERLVVFSAVRMEGV